MRSSIFILLFVVILAGCNSNSGKNTTKNVAAVVNGTEITEREIDYLFQQQFRPGMSAAQSFNLRKAILADLVKTQLLAQKARSLNLQNSPDYTIATYNSQNSVLAMMAEKKLTEKVKNPDADLLDDIIKNNPILFNQRKIYNYDEVVIGSVDNALLEDIDKKISNKFSIQQILDFLKGKKVACDYSFKTVASDNIPEQLLSALDRMTPGVPQVIRVLDRYSFIIVLHNSFASPVTGIQAKQKAEYLYRSRQTQEVLSKEMASFLNSSDIKYYGDYAKKNVNNGLNIQDLPYPDHKIAQRQQFKKLLSLVLLAISLVSSVLSLTAAMRFIRGTLWLPRLWPIKKSEENADSIYEIPFELHFVHQIGLIIIGLLFLSGISYEVIILWEKIHAFYVMLSILIGVLIGIGASQIYSLKKIQEWTDKSFFMVAALFVLPVFVNLLLIMRFSNL